MNLELKKISRFDLPGYVEIAYAGDSDLLDKYWGTGFSLNEAVNETVNLIALTAQEVEMNYYGVLCQGDEIGYICFFKNNLYSFSINKEYRKKDLLIEFWDKIVEVIGEGFICILFPQNTRALIWLKKCGMVEVPDIENVDENCVVLIYILNNK